MTPDQKRFSDAFMAAYHKRIDAMPIKIGGVVLRKHLMESVMRPAYTSRRLDGHRIRRCRIKQLGVNCAQAQDICADIFAPPA